MADSYVWKNGEGYYPTLGDVEEELRAARDGRPFKWPVPRMPGSEKKEKEMGAVAWATAKFAICSGAAKIEDVAESHFGWTIPALKNVFYGERWPTLTKLKRWAKLGYSIGHKNSNSHSEEKKPESELPLESRSLQQLVETHQAENDDAQLLAKMQSMTVAEWAAALDESKKAYRKMAAQIAVSRIANHKLGPVTSYKDLEIADRIARRNLGLDDSNKGGSGGGATINIGMLGMSPDEITRIPSPATIDVDDVE